MTHPQTAAMLTQYCGSGAASTTGGGVAGQVAQDGRRAASTTGGGSATRRLWLFALSTVARSSASSSKIWSRRNLTLPESGASGCGARWLAKSHALANTNFPTLMCDTAQSCP